DAAIDAVKTQKVKLLPEFQERIFFEWMNNIQDWCISRQLWWGHRVPVWYCKPHGHVTVSEEDITQCGTCASKDLVMDTDVLDTWFSSGLWPFSTLGWPEQTEDLRAFYPTEVLVTGYDILFFWVARMMMLGIKFMGDVPFHEVLLHGLQRDANGEKMSKTKGNGLDPLVMADKYGADALRFTLATGTVLGQDMILQESAIEGHRNFINKVWNAAKFALGHTERLGAPPALTAVKPGRFDRWILGRLQRTADEVNKELDARRFNEAAKALYHFVWHELCDWYVEISKPMLFGERGPEAQAAAHATLYAVLGDALKLLHPMMPFVTEEIWEALGIAKEPLIIQPYPEAGQRPVDTAALTQAEQLIGLIDVLRTVRDENGIKPKTKVNVVIAAPDEALRKLYGEQESQLAIQTLAGVEAITLQPQHAKQEGEAHGVGGGFEVFIPLAGMIDVGSERERLQRETKKISAEIQKLAAKLANPNFTDKAPAAVVEKNRGELNVLETQLEKLNASLRQLG
ncbi:MAG TPA: class I tRNA ligase family protein, partial [bacterium]